MTDDALPNGPIAPRAVSEGSGLESESPEGAPPQEPSSEERTSGETEGESLVAPDREFFVVGVGASAGGLEALQKLFEALPSDTGMAFVVVQHLSPDFRSVMDELLGRYTRMPVISASDGQVVEPDHVYLMPPSVGMELRGGALHLEQRDPEKRLHLPIDDFFYSLAKDAGDRSVAVVLSGTGSDGSRGLGDVSRAGGLVLVQSESSSKFGGMPRSAIDTGLVDLVDGPRALAAALTRAASGSLDLEETVLPLRGDDLAPILSLLHKESGIDFGRYKPATIGRRIERRLALGGYESLEDYLVELQEDPSEVTRLYYDLLIGVTGFFRDPDAFAVLRDVVLPELADSLASGETLRVWVAACATGEEAYSLAMLALEALRRARRGPRLKLFATDVHQYSLDSAAEGIYSADAVRAIPSELLERYFEPHERGYIVTRELRSTIVFASHNVLRDAPFTRLDLVTCRNFLIYLRQEAQRKALSSFHFGLKSQGFLMLGSSETPTHLKDELLPVDRRWKIFRKRRDLRLPLNLDTTIVQRSLRRKTTEIGPVESAHRELVRHYAPATLVVTQEFRLLHSLNGGARFLQQRDGSASLDVLQLLEPALRVAVSSGLHRVHELEHPLVYESLQLADGERVRLTLVPVPDPEAPPNPIGSGARPGNVVLTFEPLSDEPARVAIEVADADELALQRIEQLEFELGQARSNLQAALEEMETSNEELQAANEELTAANEELQSTNEELQSVNEELYMVNAEYQAKINELTEMTDDMSHLLEATEVHTVFLDSELRIRKFTPKIAESFNLLPQDVGRRIDSFAHNLLHDGLLDELRQAMAEAESIEHEVRDRRGGWYLLRILPYQPGGTVVGVVLTLIDISALRSARSAVERQESRYRALLQASSSNLWITDATGAIVEPQPEWGSYTGQTPEEQRGDGWLDAVYEEDREQVEADWREALEAREPVKMEARLWEANGARYRFNTLSAAPVWVDGEIAEWVVHAVDCHDAEEAERKLREREGQLRAFLDYSPSALYVKDLSGRYVLCNRQAAAIIGHPVEDILGHTDIDLLPIEVARAVRENDDQVLRAGRHLEFSERVTGGDGEPILFLTHKFPLVEEDGTIYGVGGVSSDITEREEAAERDRRALQRRDRFLALLSHELRNPLGAIATAASVLSFGDAGPAARDRAIQIVAGQCRHMSLLLDDLLDVTRLNLGKLEIRWNRVDLLEASRAALDSVLTSVEAHEVSLHVELPEAPVEVMGDLSRLQQIQANLLVNAIKFTPAGGRVVLSILTTGTEVRIEVADSGRGIDPADLERIFHFFFQRDRLVERGQGGIGVGLSLVRSLVEMHAGRVDVESEGAGRGSCFRVTLPLASHAPEEAPTVPALGESLLAPDAPLIEEWSPKAIAPEDPLPRDDEAADSSSWGPAPMGTTPDETDAAPQKSPQIATAAGQPISGGPESRQNDAAALGPLEVVVVEDSVDNRELMELLLSQLGHRVTTADDGRSGVDQILSQRPDLAFVDIGLPLMTGDRVVAEVRERWGDGTPPLMVALTGYGRKEDRDALLETGFDRYVVKPMTQERLDDLLTEAAARRRTESGGSKSDRAAT